ncbi:MAG: tRNA 2-thiouridine(34) synthase MnmA [Proteobacteria bacterium]|nr:tRNA 2-thiouridine(34) synthase MnmA [Pseudomonadota bacterium]
MSKKKRVIVAMSGGVDSSVAAALLKEKGFEVIGVTLDLRVEKGKKIPASSCCGLDAIKSAERVAHKLGIRHYVLDFRQQFDQVVVQDFISEYGRGRTPNPCVRCNQLIKFGSLFQKLDELDSDFLATGHYARIVFDQKEGAYELLRGVDPAKDQSYFLWPMTQRILARTLMPLGEFEKRRVRQMAVSYKLATAQRPESQEICFVPDQDYIGFVRERSPEAFRPGPIQDTSGKRLGEHEGLPAFTIGQKRRLKLKVPEVYYVIRIKAEENVLVVGKESDLSRKFIQVEGINWIRRNSSPGVFVGQVKIRSQHAPVEAVIRGFVDRADIEFMEKQRAAAPGQSAVFYRGEEVIGGGIIK